MVTTTATVLLWVYIVLLLIGGAIGWLLGRSKISFFFSLAFAAALVLCVRGILPFETGLWLVGILGGFFIIRYMRTHKFMPSGLMMTLTWVFLLLLIFF